MFTLSTLIHLESILNRVSGRNLWTANSSKTISWVILPFFYRFIKFTLPYNKEFSNLLEILTYMLENNVHSIELQILKYEHYIKIILCQKIEWKFNKHCCSDMGLRFCCLQKSKFAFTMTRPLCFVPESALTPSIITPIILNGINMLACLSTLDSKPSGNIVYTAIISVSPVLSKLPGA